MSEVKSQVVRLNKRAGLVYMIAQYILKRLLHQVRGRVSALYGRTAFGIYGRGDLGIHAYLSTRHFTVVEVFSPLVLLHICHGKDSLTEAYLPAVGHLASHLCVERRAA